MSPTERRSMLITQWWNPNETAAAVSIWPIGELGTGADTATRATLLLEIGAATVCLRPNSDELHALIAALQWSLGALEPAAAAEPLEMA